MPRMAVMAAARIGTYAAGEQNRGSDPEFGSESVLRLPMFACSELARVPASQHLDDRGRWHVTFRQEHEGVVEQIRGFAGERVASR